VHLPTLVVLGTIVPTFALSVYYFWRAVRSSRYDAIAFLACCVYGMAVELLAIRTTEAYDYADLWLMLGSSPDWVPYSIGVTWAMVIFVVMTTSDRLGLPWGVRPLLDGALATILDLVIDPVSSASRWVTHTGTTCMNDTTPLFGGFGVWTWCVPTGDRALWFTIPLANFLGWFVVVAAISFTIRAGRVWLGADKWRPLAQGALLLGLAAAALALVIAVARVYQHDMLGVQGQRALFAAVLIGPLVYVAVGYRRWNYRNPRDLGLLLLPAFAWGGGVGSFLITGIDRASWPGAAVRLVMVALGGVGLYLLPYIQTLRRPSTS
jgi:hypothetical protein